MFKRFAILSLCAVLAMETLLPPGALADVVGLPEVFAHLERNRQESPDIRILQSLSLDHDDAEHLSTPQADHQKLPFSKRRHRPVVPLQSLPGEAAIQAPKVTRVLMIIGEVIYRAAAIPSFSSSIWQPPKI